MPSRVRTAASAGIDRRHRLGIGVAVAVGASLSVGATAEALAAPMIEQAAATDGRVAPEEAGGGPVDDVSSALDEVAVLQGVLERTSASSGAIGPEDPARRALSPSIVRAASPVVDAAPDGDAAPEPAAEPEPAPAPEPTPEPEPEPEPEPAPAPEPEAASAPDTTSTSGVSRATWEAVAACESNGDWTIDTGNSFYGGLQFNLESWTWAGGQQYAEYPHQATKDQQIAVADQLIEIHPAGWGAWPACSAKLGLR